MSLEVEWDKVKSIAEKYQKKILSLPEVVGISTGVLRESGKAQPCLRIYLKKPLKRGEFKDNKIPLQIEGVPVDIVISGEFKMFDN